MYIIDWNHESLIYINLHKQIMAHFKEKHGFIFIGYHKSHI